MIRSPGNPCNPEGMASLSRRSVDLDSHPPGVWILLAVIIGFDHSFTRYDPAVAQNVILPRFKERINKGARRNAFEWTRMDHLWAGIIHRAL